MFCVPRLSCANVQVYKATRGGTTEVAVKRLTCVVTEVQLEQMRRETAIMRRVSYHPHVVQFYGAILSDPPMLCMEYMKVRGPTKA